MKIAQVSKDKNMSIDSLRYYERIGLIPPVKRVAGDLGANEKESRAL